MSESALETARANWYDAEYVVLWNGIEVDRFASAVPTPTRLARRRSSSAATSRARDSTCCSTRGAPSIATPCSGSAAPARRPTSSARDRPAPNIEWLGAITDAERNARLRGATVLCAPSLHGESFGVVLLEGMAAGTPVVASDDRGLPERRARRRRRAARSARRRRSRSAARCARVFDDAALRDRLVAAGRSRAEEFSMARLAERYLELYERVLVPVGVTTRVHRLALDLAARVRDAVAPSLGDPRARAGVGVAPGGDVTMAIDEIAEHVTTECCAEAGDIAFYSEDQGYVEIGRPRAILLVDPIDGTRPAAAGFESCCVSVAVLPPSRDATLGDVEFGVVHEIKNGHRFFATRGEGAHAERVDGSAMPIARSANTDLRALFFATGDARPAGRRDVGAARGPDRRLVDARRLLRPRLGDVRHDAHRHRPARRVRRPGLARARRAARARARVPGGRRRRGLHELPLRRRGGDPDRRGGGWRRDGGRRRFARRRTRRSDPATATAWPCSRAPRRPCTTSSSTRSPTGMRRLRAHLRSGRAVH